MTENSKIFEIRKKRHRDDFGDKFDNFHNFAQFDHFGDFSTASKTTRSRKNILHSESICEEKTSEITAKTKKKIGTRISKRISTKASKLKRQLKDFLNNKLGLDIKDISESTLKSSSYEEFLNILKENIISRVKTESSKNNLEVTSEITNVSVIGSEFINKICSICISPVNFETKHYLKCGHAFHDKCISDWLKVSSFCPNCKLQVPNNFNWRQFLEEEEELLFGEEIYLDPITIGGRMIAHEMGLQSFLPGGSNYNYTLIVSEILDACCRAILVYLFIMVGLIIYAYLKTFI